MNKKNVLQKKQKAGIDILICIFLITSVISCHGGNDRIVRDSTPISHALWDTLLHQYVHEGGFVDYKGLVQDSTRLNQYLALLSNANPTAKNWSRETKMAFWINAYNAFTVKLIIDHYPIKGIKDIKQGIPFVNSVWDIKFIRIGGQTYDLNNIEHGMLRSEFRDSRIHAAINCASYSCPALRNEAFVPERLEAQLTDAMHNFVNDPIRNRVTANKASISKIFKWYQGDFTAEKDNIRNYINQYALAPLNANGKVAYLEYDWRLNEVK